MPKPVSRSSSRHIAHRRWTPDDAKATLGLPGSVWPHAPRLWPSRRPGLSATLALAAPAAVVE